MVEETGPTLFKFCFGKGLNWAVRLKDESAATLPQSQCGILLKRTSSTDNRRMLVCKKMKCTTISSMVWDRFILGASSAV